MKESAMVRWMQRLGTGAVDFLLPPRCAACGTRILSHGHLCAACWPKLAPISDPRCSHCGIPFSTDVGEGALCGACLQAPPAFDWARAPVSYEGLGKDLVLKLKHGGVGAAVPALATLMAGATPSGHHPDVIVPVPLHRWRLLRRRFNQSQLLAFALARKMDVPCDPFALERYRKTPSQGPLGRKARQKNVRGAFRVPGQARERVQGKTVLLVDDVLTTGATASACATALKKAGALEVGVIAVARVGGPQQG